MYVFSRSSLAAVALAAGFAACTTTNGAVAVTTPAGSADTGSPPDAAVIHVELEAELGLNDVSILEPLPAGPSATAWLAATSAGAMGELLPKAVFDAIPKFPVSTEHSLLYPNMRVLGLRFDGCHKSADGCKAQIRLVMQPVSSNGKARDSALHLFYSLSPENFALAVHRLRAMRALAPEQALDAPLSVSPALAAQGMEGAYAQALHGLVLELCGEQNLTRMTFFLRAPPKQETWFFGGFERADGSLQTMSIEGIGKSNQRVIRFDDASGYNYDVNPAPTKPEDGTALLSTKSASTANDELRAKTFASYMRLENPRTYSPDDVACAGCHLASIVIGESQRSFSLSTASFPDAQFSSKYLEGPSAERQTASGAQRSSLRAFGYFDETAMVAPRTVNETAAVLEDIAARYAATAL